MFAFARNLPAFINRKFHYWVGRRMPEKSGKIRLSLHSTYILPTRYGVLFSIVLYGMLMSAINYSNSMGFLLTFLLAGICLTGMLHTFRNLITIVIAATRDPPVFAGETAVFCLRLEMSDGRASYAIAAGRTRHEGRRLDIGENQQQTLTIHVPTVHRGRLPLGRIRIWTEFPLGLFHVWTWVEPDASLVVYPQPAGKRYRLASGLTGAGRLAAQTAGYDDFAGLRRYHPGDSLRHIDWKAAARRHQILTKQFSDPAGDDIWLDWECPSMISVSRR
jgi:uncharacterized protein (DUF58 family)